MAVQLADAQAVESLATALIADIETAKAGIDAIFVGLSRAQETNAPIPQPCLADLRSGCEAVVSLLADANTLLVAAQLVTSEV